MKKILSIVLAVLMLAFPLRVKASSDYSTAHLQTHMISESYILGEAICSATAIGPHALLTASHCELPTDEMDIDDHEDVKILGIRRDGADHTIYTVDMSFSNYARVSDRLPEVGEEVFIFGNPGGVSDVLRKGYIAKVEPPSKSIFGGRHPGILILDLNGYYGDSGAAIFDAQGSIVGVISVSHTEKDKEDKAQMKVMGGFTLSFSSQILTSVREGK